MTRIQHQSEPSGREMDAKQLTQMFEDHRERLARLVEIRMDRRLRGRVNVSDVLQETYLEAHRRAEDYEPERMPGFLWLRMLAGQKLIDLYRHHVSAKKRSIRKEAEVEMPGASSAVMADHFVASMTSVSEAAIRVEQRERMERWIEEMEEVDREILALRHFEQLTNAEIASVLGISQNAASNRYVRALAKLKRLMDDAPGSEPI